MIKLFLAIVPYSIVWRQTRFSRICRGRTERFHGKQIAYGNRSELYFKNKNNTGGEIYGVLDLEIRQHGSFSPTTKTKTYPTPFVPDEMQVFEMCLSAEKRRFQRKQNFCKQKHTKLLTVYRLCTNGFSTAGKFLQVFRQTLRTRPVWRRETCAILFTEKNTVCQFFPPVKREDEKRPRSYSKIFVLRKLRGWQKKKTRQFCNIFEFVKQNFFNYFDYFEQQKIHYY